MRLWRLFAYTVIPQRTVAEADRVDPVGREISVEAEVETALTYAISAARNKMTRVALVLNTDPSSRTSEVRDAVMRAAFERNRRRRRLLPRA